MGRVRDDCRSKAEIRNSQWMFEMFNDDVTDCHVKAFAAIEFRYESCDWCSIRVVIDGE
jgi:hypothetical protein